MQHALRPAQVAVHLSVSPSQVYALISQGKLPAIRVGVSGITVLKTDVDNCIQQNQHA